VTHKRNRTMLNASRGPPAFCNPQIPVTSWSYQLLCFSGTQRSGVRASAPAAPSSKPSRFFTKPFYQFLFCHALPVPPSACDVRYFVTYVIPFFLHDHAPRHFFSAQLTCHTHFSNFKWHIFLDLRTFVLLQRAILSQHPFYRCA
jgi:hypothetical protein